MTAGLSADDLVDFRLDELAEVTERIIALNTEIAELTIHLRVYTAEAWLNAEGSTTERNHRVTYETYVPQDGTPAFGAEITRKEAELRSWIERRDYLRILLTHGR